MRKAQPRVLRIRSIQPPPAQIVVYSEGYKPVTYKEVKTIMDTVRAGTPLGSAVRAFLFSFVATFVTAVLPLLDRAAADITDKGRVNIDVSYVVALLLAVVIAATTAALRYVAAKFLNV